MSFLREVFWFVMLFGVLEIVVEAIERRAARKRSAWRFGHPGFFQDLKRGHFPEDLQ